MYSQVQQVQTYGAPAPQQEIPEPPTRRCERLYGERILTRTTKSSLSIRGSGVPDDSKERCSDPSTQTCWAGQLGTTASTTGCDLWQAFWRTSTFSSEHRREPFDEQQDNVTAGFYVSNSEPDLAPAR